MKPINRYINIDSSVIRYQIAITMKINFIIKCFVHIFGFDTKCMYVIRVHVYEIRVHVYEIRVLTPFTRVLTLFTRVLRNTCTCTFKVRVRIKYMHVALVFIPWSTLRISSPVFGGIPRRLQVARTVLRTRASWARLYRALCTCWGIAKNPYSSRNPGLFLSPETKLYVWWLMHGTTRQEGSTTGKKTHCTTSYTTGSTKGKKRKCHLNWAEFRILWFMSKNKVINTQESHQS